MKKYWFYIHINGSLCLKRYIDDQQLQEAFESSMCQRIFKPFEAIDSNTAIEIACQKANGTPTHCVTIENGFECMSCGMSKTISTPVEVSVFLKWAWRFINDHRECKRLKKYCQCCPNDSAVFIHYDDHKSQCPSCKETFAPERLRYYVQKVEYKNAST